MLVTQVIAADLNPNSQQLLIDKGTQDGVYQGQAAVDAHGVVGQVMEADLHASRILVLTDSLSRIPLQNNRTGDRVIATGLGRVGRLDLMNVTDQADIQVGDTYSASGMGLHYPVGYPVAKVYAVGNRLVNNEKTVQTRLLAQPQRDHVLLLLWPRHAMRFKPDGKAVTMQQAGGLGSSALQTPVVKKNAVYRDH